MKGNDDGTKLGGAKGNVDRMGSGDVGRVESESENEMVSYGVGWQLVEGMPGEELGGGVRRSIRLKLASLISESAGIGE